MAYGLSSHPNGGFNTSGLATIAHEISKADLRPGDILLNTQADAHVVIFGGWISNGQLTTTVSDQYDALEENGSSYYGYAVEHTIPYPYYSGYNTQAYVPMQLNVNSNPVPPTQPPAPTTIPGIDQFVGTWWVGGGAITLTIKSDGSATYVASGGNSQIQFTNVSGNTASGTVVSGTSIPIGPQGNSIPVGGTITVTLVDQHTLQVSNGYVLCPNTEQCAN